METKMCSKCDEVKPLSEFYPRKSVPDGKESACKACRREAFKKRDRNTGKRGRQKVYRVRMKNRNWEVVYSPVDKYGNETWPTGARLANIDVTATLKFGYFDEGMKILNIDKNIEYTVAQIDERQVLENGNHCLCIVKDKMKRVDKELIE